MFQTALWQHDLQWVPWAVVVGGSFVAAITDMRGRRIPNWLTGPLLLSGLVWGCWMGGLAGLGESLLGCVTLAFPCLILFAVAGGGAGDAKLLAAAGAWLGLINSVIALLGVSIAGIVLGMAFALATRRARAVLSTTAAAASMAVMTAMGSPGAVRMDVTNELPQTTKQTMPYGVVIAVGLLLAGMGTLLWRA